MAWLGPAIVQPADPSVPVAVPCIVLACSVRNMSTPRRFHLAVPVSDLAAARAFYGGVLGCEQGRESDHWIDWDLFGHQFVTHLAPPVEDDRPSSEVDGHQVPIPHFGVLLQAEEFHALAGRVASAGTAFLIEPYLRFAGQPAEHWTMFFCDPAGNALEFKAFTDDGSVFAT
jgi:extradiol dioxygenase family protein